ncbi:uncharacterized protein LOC133039343, partial [Cannabis sativa]|uniref:uncharacterized protein LOC133039343 n=1 Tax=Cannabis sativa TaxID=3483 RepID=UPI0029C9C0ED
HVVLLVGEIVVRNLGQNEGQNDDNFWLDRARYEALIEQVADEAQEDSDFVEDEYALEEDDVGEAEVNTTEPSIWWLLVNDFCNQQEEDNSSIGYDDDEDLHSLKSGDEGDCESKKSRKEFTPRDEWLDFKFDVELEFANVDQLREAITEYFIANDREFVYIFNNQTKLKAVCKAKGCPWSLYARVQKRDNTTFRINSIWNVHNCGIVFNSRHVDATWLAKHFIDQFRMNPNMHYSNFMELTTESKFSHTTSMFSTMQRKRLNNFFKAR